MQVPLQPRDVGANIGLSFRLTLAHFAKLFPLFLILSLPGLGVQLAAAGPPEDVSAGLLVASLFLPMVLQTITTAAATVIVASSFTGEGGSLGGALNIAVKRFLALLGFSLLMGLVVGLGFLLLIVPGLILMTRFYVGSCAVVLDDKAPGAAFGRSASLTEGRRWSVFAFIVVFSLIFFVVPGACAGVLGVMLGMDLESTEFTIVTWAIGVFAGLFGVVAPVVMYFDLRVRAESLDVAQLARLVDRIGAGRGSK